MRREYPDAPIVGVGAVILKDGQILVVQRGRPPAVGMWSIPGGVVELGERLEDAVRREIAEECDLTVEIEDTVEVLDRITPGATAGRDTTTSSSTTWPAGPAARREPARTSRPSAGSRRRRWTGST